MTYNHTQIGSLMIYVLIAVVFLFGSIILKTGVEPVVIGIMGVVCLILTSFVTLNVRIDQTHLRIKFGYGLFRKKFALRDIKSVKTVRNNWYNGWGIRVWFWPYRWLYNVSGFDAVEIVKKDGKIFRIGTDEPGDLEQAIRRVLGK